MKLGFFAVFWCVIAINAFKGNSFLKDTDVSQSFFFNLSPHEKELLLNPATHQNHFLKLPQKAFILASNFAKKLQYKILWFNFAADC